MSVFGMRNEQDFLADESSSVLSGFQLAEISWIWEVYGRTDVEAYLRGDTGGGDGLK